MAETGEHPLPRTRPQGRAGTKEVSTMQTTIVKVKVGEDFRCPICGAEYVAEWYDRDAGMITVGYWEETGRCPHLPADYEFVGENEVEFVFTCEDN
jgi:hypothetical protein